MSKVSPTLSPIRWMVTRDRRVDAGYVTDPLVRVYVEVVKDGFTKSTAAKAFKDGLKEEGLKIIPYYE